MPTCAFNHKTTLQTRRLPTYNQAEVLQQGDKEDMSKAKKEKKEKTEGKKQTRRGKKAEKAEVKAKTNGSKGRGRGRPKKENGGAELNYRFVNREGGKVVFSGLTDDKDVPSKVADLLIRYGFEKAAGGEWIDVSCPQPSEPLEGILTSPSTFAPVQVTLQPPKTKRSHIKYSVQIGAGDTCTNEDALVAMTKAHRSWNKNGRDVRGVPLSQALTAVL